MTIDTGDIRKYPNPFNPGFGVAPPLLAGRAALVHTVLAGVHRGPGRVEYHSVLVGSRGTGKTVLLKEIASQLERERGAVVIPWAGAQSLNARLLSARPIVEATLQTKPRRLKADVELTIKGAPAGVGLEAKVSPRRSTVDNLDLHDLLSTLARSAAAKRRMVLLVADEIQASSPHDLVQLALALQQIANTEALPLSLLAAGLPATRERFGASGATFLGRQPLTPIGALDDAAVTEALSVPFGDAGRTVSQRAMEMMVQATGGFPYSVQLVGYHTWEAADGRSQVQVADAKQGCLIAQREVEARMFVQDWQRLPPADRAFLVAATFVADPRGLAATAAIATRMGRTRASLSAARDRAINDYGLLVVPRQGQLQFTLPGFADWVRRTVKAEAAANRVARTAVVEHPHPEP